MDRSIAPKTSDRYHVNFVKPVCIDSDISFYHIDNKSDETIRLELVFEAGSKFQNKKLQSSFLSELMLSGTPNKTSKEINDAIDQLGGYFQCEADKDVMTISIYCLSKNLEAIWEEVEEAILNVTFPENEFETLRSVKEQQFKVNNEKVSYLSRRAFSAEMFEDGSAYDTQADLEDFATINVDDVKDFYKSNVVNGLKGIFHVGSLSDELKHRLIAFGRETKGEHKVSQPHYSNSPGAVHIEKEGAIQSAIRIGKFLVNRGHEDFVPLLVLNTVYGGYFGSRLMANIREDKGYTYGIGSGIVPMLDAAYFFISTEVGSEVREDALKEIQKELQLLHDELIPISELDLVRNYLSGKFLKGTDGPFSMMDRYKALWFFNLEYDYYDNYFEVLNSITPEKLKEITNKYLVWESMSVVSAG